MNVFCSPTRTPLAAINTAVECFSQPKLRRHELWAVTCYFRPKALRFLVLELLDRIKLTDVYIAYNYAEDFRYPSLADEMERLTVELAKLKVNLSFRRIKPESGLFHSKGYAVIQLDGQTDKIRDNYLLVTSGNLTEQGLGIKEATSNFELGYGSKVNKDVRAFMAIVDSIWDNKNLRAESKLEQNISDIEIQTSILLEATYLCKWEGSLRRELTANFKVAEGPMARIVPGEMKSLLSSMGFEIDPRSLGKYYFDDRPPKPLPKYFLKNYTANTLIGHWCPSSVWDVVRQVHKDKFEEFKEWFKNATSESALKAIDEEFQRDLIELKKSGIKIDGNPIDSLRNRISKLIGNDVKMWRLYSQYESFSLRYDLEDTDAIEELFGSLKETAESRTKKNMVIRKLIDVMQTHDTDKMKLTQEQSNRLKIDLANDAVDEDVDDGG